MFLLISFGVSGFMWGRSLKVHLYQIQENSSFMMETYRLAYRGYRQHVDYKTFQVQSLEDWILEVFSMKIITILFIYPLIDSFIHLLRHFLSCCLILLLMLLCIYCTTSKMSVREFNCMQKVMQFFCCDWMTLSLLSLC